MVKQNLLTKLLLLFALIVGSVSSVWADDNYSQVTSVADLDTEATYIIGDVDNNNTARAFGAISNNRGTIITTGLSVSGTIISVASEATNKPLEFTLTKSGENYLISYGSTYLTYNSGTNFGTSSTSPTANSGKWAIAYNDTYKCLLINNVGTTSRYILRNGTSAYGPYSNTNLSSYGKATLYKKIATTTDPTITFNNGSVNVGKNLDLNTLFTSNSAGSVTYSITEGDSYASIVGSTLTGVAVGSVTVQATQAAAGTYNTKSVTATITVNAALTLTSIAITSAPTKTTYTVGDLFDSTGMVVTATYSDDSTDDVTEFCTWSPNGALAISTTEITIIYTENSVTKTATQVITVMDYQQSPQVKISLNNAFFGTSYTGADAKGSGSHSGESNRITVNFISGGDKNNFYISNTEIRAYSGNTLEFVAPSGYKFTKMEFASAWATGITVDEGSLNNNRTIWTNDKGSSAVAFTPTSRSDITTVTIYLAASATVTTAEYATYKSDNALDFSANEGITVYTATDNGASVTLNEVTSKKVPANTPVILKGAAGSYLGAVIASADDLGANDLHISDGTTAKGDDIYVLANKSNGVGFYKWAGDGSLSAGKIYLKAKDTSTGAPFLGFDADGETTGISSLTPALSQGEGVYYDLSGRRVAQPTKGLYIVNGKKVVIK